MHTGVWLTEGICSRMPVILFGYSKPLLLEQRIHKSKGCVHLINQCDPRTYVRHMTGIQKLVEVTQSFAGKSSQNSLKLERTDLDSQCHLKAVEMGSLVTCHPEAISHVFSFVCVPISYQAIQASPECSETKGTALFCFFSRSQAETPQFCFKCCLREPKVPGYRLWVFHPLDPTSSI